MAKWMKLMPLLLAIALMAGGFSAVSGQSEICSNGTVVPDPNDNPDLVSDCEALLAIKASFDHSSNLDLLWDANFYINGWEGVTVGGDPGRVTSLALDSRIVSDGSISPRVGELTALTRLSLRNLSLDGTIPSELGNLTSLTSLDLSFNTLEGSIPSELGNLTELSSLRLNAINNLSGQIPASLGNLTELTYLNLGDTSLEGTIPPELLYLENLRTLLLAPLPGEPIRYTGCIPKGLKDINNNDLDQLNLPECDDSVRPPRRETSSGSKSFATGSKEWKETCLSDLDNPKVGGIQVGEEIIDSWVEGCFSFTRGSGRLAKYYTFSLTLATAVEIDLGSGLDDYLILRSGDHRGTIVAEDDDSGPQNDSEIIETLSVGDYTIEATTSDEAGIERDFTLSVKASSQQLFSGLASSVASSQFSPSDTTIKVTLLPTLPIATLEIAIEDDDGFADGEAPLGGVRTSVGSSGTLILSLPQTAWVEHGDIVVEVKKSDDWVAHSAADEQGLLNDDCGTELDLSAVMPGLLEVLGKSEGALEIIESLADFNAEGCADTSTLRPTGIPLDAIFQERYANCMSQLSVSWLSPVPESNGVRILVPVVLGEDDYFSLAASFVAKDDGNGAEPALAQIHDLLDTGESSPTCARQ